MLCLCVTLILSLSQRFVKYQEVTVEKMETKETERLTLTVEEAAQAIGISRGTAYDLIRQKKLPAIRISERRLVVPKAALAKLLDLTTK